ncbi:MAG TPA: DUF952 domain-containing protein [Ignavibacteria bacterium]|nr:DUF952 domain-containing protein [Ignavibacteria bacterium]HMR39125.1 DUF952 domain-containing protein [Ignavibacteria bacterium]
MIYHITNLTNWLKASGCKYYEPVSLETEGFIHCSPKEMIIEVANSFYRGQKDLLLLSIDESKVESKIIREDLYEHGFEFPHIYGPLNLDAVTEVNDLICSRNESFIIPENI